MRTVPDKPLTKAQTDTEQVVHAAAEDKTPLRRPHSTLTTRRTTTHHRRPHPLLPQLLRFVLIPFHSSIVHHRQSLHTDG